MNGPFARFGEKIDRLLGLEAKEATEDFADLPDGLSTQQIIDLIEWKGTPRRLSLLLREAGFTRHARREPFSINSMVYRWYRNPEANR